MPRAFFLLSCQKQLRAIGGYFLASSQFAVAVVRRDNQLVFVLNQVMWIGQHFGVKVRVIAGARPNFKVVPHSVNRILPLPRLFLRSNLCRFLGLRLGNAAAAVKFGVVDFSRLNIKTAVTRHGSQALARCPAVDVLEECETVAARRVATATADKSARVVVGFCDPEPVFAAAAGASGVLLVAGRG